MAQFIEVNGTKVALKITAKQLEKDYKTTYRGGKKNSNKKHRHLKNNPKQIVLKLANCYGVDYRWINDFDQHTQLHRVGVEIPALKLFAETTAPSRRRGFRQLFYVIHQSYCNLIINE